MYLVQQICIANQTPLSQTFRIPNFYLLKELETQREQHSLRVAELEEELSNSVAKDERQKIAKNVEMIQLQRSLQQQTAQLTASFAKVQVLEREVTGLQQELETTQKENGKYCYHINTGKSGD